MSKVEDTHTVLYISTIADNLSRVMLIMPGSLVGLSFKTPITHIQLPTLKAFFWYDKGFVNLIRALSLRLWISIALARKLFKAKPDICVCFEPDSWFISVLAKKIFGCKVIVDLRELYDDRALAFPKPIQKVVRKLIRSLLIRLSKNTDQIIHVSRERQEVYRYLRKPGTVISPYPRIALFPTKNSVEMIEHEFQRNSPVIVIHAGALRKTYASDQLLAAIVIARKQLSNIRLVVLGGIAGELSQKDIICKLIREGGLEIISQIPFSRVIQKLYSSDIGINLVLPVDTLHFLAQPRKLYEYFAASLPVVAADVPTIRRVVSENKCGLLVNPTSPQEIASAIITLARNVNLRKMMSLNARRAAESKFNWETQEAKLIQLIKSMGMG